MALCSTCGKVGINKGLVVLLVGRVVSIKGLLCSTGWKGGVDKGVV